MEYTINKLTKEQNTFFNNLNEYLNTKIIFVGSVQRADFFKESDTDIIIFTNNETITKYQIINFLKINNDIIKDFIWKLDLTPITITGNKLLYYHPEHKIYVDISIINESYREYVIKDHLFTINLPTYSIVLLYILKIIYYKLCIMEWSVFSYLKKKIICTSLGLPESDFKIIGEDKTKRTTTFLQLFYND
jgi:predicted nucleotidyltransferase